MKRKYRRKKIRIVGAVVFLALMIFSSVFVIWQMKTNEFGGLIDRIEEVFYGTPFKNAYNAKSLILVDLSNDEVFISKRENEQQLPASLAKLFVIKYAVTLADLDNDKIRSEQLERAIMELPEVQRRRFRLYFDYGLTYEQIGKIEGCSKMPVKRSIDRAIEKIREKIKYF